MRFFASELVRETALEQLQDEVPYSVACEIEEFREEREPVYIRAVIYVERDSQKGILIGDKGARVRDIGRAARIKIERLVGAPVYLDLWVKVLPNWRRNETLAQTIRLHASGGSAHHELSRRSCSKFSCAPSAGRRSNIASRSRCSICPVDRLRYEVRDDIPIMLIDDATPY